MERLIGTVSRGVRAPIVREGDNIVEIVADSILKAQANGDFTIGDRDGDCRDGSSGSENTG